MAKHELPKPIVMFRAGTLTSQDIEKLEINGYIVIEGDPDNIKIAQTVVVPVGNEMVWRALLVGIRHSIAATDKFGHALLAEIIRQSP